MIKIAKYVMYDILRNRFVMLYTLFLLLVTFSMFSLDSDPGKSTLSLLNIILLVVPLVSIIFTTIHFFNSYEFIELLLAQPLLLLLLKLLTQPFLLLQPLLLLLLQ